MAELQPIIMFIDILREATVSCIDALKQTPPQSIKDGVCMVHNEMAAAASRQQSNPTRN